MFKRNLLCSTRIALAGALILPLLTSCSANSSAASDEASPADSSVAVTAETTQSASTAETTDDVAAQAASEVSAESAALSDAVVEGVSLTGTVSRDDKYDSAILSLTPDELEEAGISFGDSCDLTFSNGYSLTDVPYYNGYYVQTGDPVINGDVNKQRIKIARNSEEFWTPAKLAEGDTVEISLNTAGKYLSVYETLGNSYSNERSDFESDEVFANFRPVTGGNLKENFLYRGAAPTNDKYNRASYAADLVENAGVTFIMDLSDSENELKEIVTAEDYSSAYIRKLYADEDIAALGLGMDYKAASYQESVAEGMRALMSHDGPAYIHCQEGINRTGFVCILLEGLAGAGYEELRDDYMLSYTNYYGVTEEETPDKYQAVMSLYFEPIMEYLTGAESADSLGTADYEKAAEDYLTSAGMTAEEIQKLKTLITKA